MNNENCSNNNIFNNGNGRVRTTRRDMWTVQKGGSRRGEWSTITDDIGPFITPTRELARQVAGEYRNLHPRTRFRVARLTISPARKNKV